MDQKSFELECEEIAKNFYVERFYAEIGYYEATKEIKSPIEKMLLRALILLRDLNFTDNEIRITPQFPIKKYRCDFLIEYHSDKFNKQSKIIVECDSQEFHDRNEEDRRYEKIRDRCFVSQGYKIIRFTGKEITENPFTPAIEILGILTEQNIENLDSYKN